MSTQSIPNLTPEQYLAIERDCEQKHEFYRGEMFAMSGATRAHNQITFNLARVLGNQLLDRDCTAYVSDMRVSISPTGLYTYPDGIVTCEKPRFEDDQLDTLLNPQVIFEVLSESTEKYDRGKKFEQYRQIGSLTDYILISQDHAQIEHFTRQQDGQWLLSEASGLASTLALPTVDCQLSLADVYAKVEFPEATSQNEASHNGASQNEAS